MFIHILPIKQYDSKTKIKRGNHPHPRKLLKQSDRSVIQIRTAEIFSSRKKKKIRFTRVLSIRHNERARTPKVTVAACEYQKGNNSTFINDLSI